MRFGFFSLLDRYENDTRGYSELYQQVLDQMVLADELGFDSYWIGEHHGQTGSGQVMACPHPAVLLAAAAKLTRRIGLNTAVANLALRHPLQVAIDNRHFVFWSDFGGIQPELFLRSMQLIAQEVLPHFTVRAN